MRHAKDQKDIEKIIVEIKKDFRKTKVEWASDDCILITLWNGMQWTIPKRLHDIWIKLTEG